MKRIKQNFAPRLVAPPVHDRQGSVIIVVITLLTALMVLGFFAFTRAQQDQQNSDYFAQGSKKIEPLELNQDLVFDSFLRQLILGAAPTEFNSTFYGGTKSLLPTMFGTDFAPYSGEGARLKIGAGGAVFVDMDNDGNPDAGWDHLAEINHSPAAEWSVQSLVDPASPHFLPQPDVPYTYPDHTSPFLTYVGYVPVYDAAGNRQAFRRVLLPAFHRPQLLRGLGIAQNQWYTDPNTRTRVIRPHRAHHAILPDGTDSGTPRFESAFFDDPTYGVPDPNDGHWGGTALGAQPDVPNAQQYDADPSDRGVKDAVYIDIGFPMQTDPVTGQQYVPLVAPVILDGEGLLNLGIHGNSNKYKNYPLQPQSINITTTVPFGGTNGTTTQFLSSSNWGVSRSEVNPGWPMNTQGSELTTAPNWQEQYEYTFGHAPNDPIEASNMDLWCLLHGRALFGPGSPIPATSNDIVQLLAGRYGELERMDAAVSSHIAAAFPWPGTTNFDDNGNAELGNPGFAFGMTNVPTFSHPLDVFGVGEAAPYGTAAPTNRERYLFQGLNPLVYPQYREMATHPQTVWRSLFPNQLMTASVSARYGDEPDETVAEPALASQQPDDSIFLPSTTAALQISRNDLTANNISDRVLGLASINFTSSDREESIRAMFGTASSDLKSYSHVYHDPTFAANQEFRTSEFNTATSPIQFPLNNTPAIPAIRTELYELMFMEVTGYRGNDIRKLQRKLSVNGALDRDPQNNLRFRPLTPHPNGLPATRINYSGIVRPEQITNLNQREFLARRDRQKMARDIYTLLYLFGGPEDSVNYFTASRPYTDQQCQEMAQFAVNVVDALDTDDVITKFEYDVDLSNGWNLNDYPFDYSGISPADTITDIGSGSGTEHRGVVYGVETQSLCLNEGLAIIAEKVEDSSMNGMDLAATEWDDQSHNYFLQFELQNVSPQTVRFNQGQWQVAVRPLKTPRNGSGGTLIGEERRLEINSSTLTVDNSSLANSFLTVGTATKVLTDSMTSTETLAAPIFPEGSFPLPAVPPADSTNPGPSRILINDGTYNRTVAPSILVSSSQYLDLLKESGEYQIYDDSFTTTPTTDVDDHDSTMSIQPNSPTSPSGYKLLEFLGPDPMTPATAPVQALIDDGGLGDKYVELILRRRLDPNRTRPTDSSSEEKEDNPWIVMDRLQIPLQHLELEPSDTGAQVQTKIQNLDGSQSRYQPLFADETKSASDFSSPNPTNNPNDDPAAPPSDFENTLGDRNRVGGSTADYTLWQPHLNRDYASLAELMNVPLYGPDRLKNVEQAPFYDSWTFPTMKIGDTVAGGNGETAKLTGTETFGFRVLHPDPSPFYPIPPTPNPPTDDNRWHRVLNFLEVPRRQAISGFSEKVGYLLNPNTGQFEDGHQDPVYRNHGPLNVNTIRHPEVYAAMLDDDRVMRLQNPADPPATTYLQDALSDRFVAAGVLNNDDWWASFLASRDGLDIPTPVEGYRVIVPGIPGISHPFQPLSYNAEGQASLEETILRPLVPTSSLDSTISDQRQLFELGNKMDHENNVIDYAERYRLLGKTMNHSTLTSNTFYIFLQVDYFEATDTGGGAVQIGAKLSNSPGYRGFFVVDRAKALDMVTPNDLPPTEDPYSGASLFSFNQNFDWRSLVLYRRRLN